MSKKIFLSISLSVFMTGCATTTTPEKTVEAPQINDFPTRDRVEYVFNCIAKHGGLSGSKAFINQYACGCKIDKIAEKMTFEEYESAKTFSYLKKTPGENGAAFRDPKQSKDLRTRLKEADKYAESQCFVM
ncbi:MAG: hypothetical protein KAH20_07955 [Methylococcales bacterium]|nr:hypothetical protein [Methylococcales bacterium]